MQGDGYTPIWLMSLRGVLVLYRSILQIMGDCCILASPKNEDKKRELAQLGVWLYVLSTSGVTPAKRQRLLFFEAQALARGCLLDGNIHAFQLYKADLARLRDTPPCPHRRDRFSGKESRQARLQVRDDDRNPACRGHCW